MLVKCQPNRNMMSPFFDNFLRMDSPNREVDLAPRCDVLDLKDNYTIQMEIPGVQKEDMKVEFKDHVLTISGRKNSAERQEGENYFREERLFGAFSRSFRIGEEVDGTKISAGYRDGVLEVVLPKTEKALPKTVDIRVN